MRKRVSLRRCNKKGVGLQCICTPYSEANMNRIQFLLGFGLLTTFSLASQSLAQEPKDKKSPTDVEVLTRGALHEAFAQPIGIKPEPGPTVPKEPPPTLPEEPAAQKPDVESAQWIPGYWAWDAEKQDYFWVSG